MLEHKCFAEHHTQLSLHDLFTNATAVATALFRTDQISHLLCRLKFLPPEMMAFGQTLFARPAPAVLQTIHCENILGDYVGNAITKDSTPYDIAIVDLMFNECGLALAHRHGIPAVGYWAFSFSSGWQVSTGESINQSGKSFHLPILRSSQRNLLRPPLCRPSCPVLEAE